MAIISSFPVTRPTESAGRSPAFRLLRSALVAASLYAGVAVMNGPAPHRIQAHSGSNDTFGLRSRIPLKPDAFLDRLSALEGTARALFLGRDRGVALTDRQQRMLAEAEATAGETFVVFDTTDLANILTTARKLTSGASFPTRLATANTLLELSSHQPLGFTGAYGTTHDDRDVRPAATDRLFAGLPLSADGITPQAEDLLLLHELGHAQTLRNVAGQSIREVEVLADVYAALAFIRASGDGPVSDKLRVQPLLDLRDLRAIMVLDRDHDTVAALDEVLKRFGNRAGVTRLARMDNDAVLALAKSITQWPVVRSATDVHDAADEGKPLMAALHAFHDTLMAGETSPSRSSLPRYQTFEPAEQRYARMLVDQLAPALERTPDLGRFLPRPPDVTIKALAIIGAGAILPLDADQVRSVARLDRSALSTVEHNQDPEALIRFIEGLPDDGALDSSAGMR